MKMCAMSSLIGTVAVFLAVLNCDGVVAGQSGDDYRSCQALVDCSALMEQAECNNHTSEGCLWNLDTCKGPEERFYDGIDADMSAGGEFDSGCFGLGETECTRSASCSWLNLGGDVSNEEDSFCADKTCYDFEEEATCILFPIDYGCSAVCKWNSSRIPRCFEPDDIDCDEEDRAESAGGNSADVGGEANEDLLSADLICTDSETSETYDGCVGLAGCHWCGPDNCTDVDNIVNGEYYCESIPCADQTDETECTVLPQCIFVNGTCRKRVYYRPDNSPCFARADQTSCNSEADCFWDNGQREDRTQSVPAHCRGPCETRFALTSMEGFGDNGNCGTGCIPPVLRSNYPDRYDGAEAYEELMCLNESTAPCRFFDSESCQAQSSRCSWDFEEFICPFSICGRGSPCGRRSSCITDGFNSSSCCGEINQYCSAVTGFGGGIDDGDGIDSACQDAALRREMTARFQSSWGSCVLEGIEDSGSTIAPDGEEDYDWQSESSCFNGMVINNRSRCLSLYPRCFWQDLILDTGVDADSGYCTEATCLLFTDQNNCSRFNGNFSCVWDTDSGTCIDGTILDGEFNPILSPTNNEDIDCAFLSESDECTSNSCIWWMDSEDDFGMCLSRNCPSMPTDALCNNLTGSNCSWTSVSGDNFSGYCFTEIEAVPQQGEECFSVLNVTACNNTVDCSWFTPNDNANSGWCEPKSCDFNVNESSCQAFDLAPCLWTSTECILATCDALENSVTCESFEFEGQRCEWKDDYCQYPVLGDEDVYLDNAFESPVDRCYSSTYLNNATACTEAGCFYAFEMCQPMSCEIFTDQPNCTAQNCTWVIFNDPDAVAGEFQQEFSYCRPRETDDTCNGPSSSCIVNSTLETNQFIKTFPECSDKTSFEDCSELGYCYWVPGGPGCREVDLFCDLVQPVACDDYTTDQSCVDAPLACTWTNNSCHVEVTIPAYPGRSTICIPDTTTPIFNSGRYIIPTYNVLPVHLREDEQYTQECLSGLCYSCQQVEIAAIAQTLPISLYEEVGAFDQLLEELTDCCTPETLSPTVAPSLAPTKTPTEPIISTIAPVAANTGAPNSQTSAPSTTAPSSQSSAPHTSPVVTSRPTSTRTYSSSSSPISTTSTLDQGALNSLSPEEDDGNSGLVVVGIFLAILVVAVAGYIIYKKKAGLYSLVGGVSFDNPAFNMGKDKLMYED